MARALNVSGAPDGYSHSHLVSGLRWGVVENGEIQCCNETAAQAYKAFLTREVHGGVMGSSRSSKCPSISVYKASISVFLERGLEAIISLFHVELELPCLVVVQLLRGSHLIQCNKPLHNLALAFELLIRDLVNRLYDFDQ